MGVIKFLSDYFDVRKLKSECNVKDCGRIPTKDILFFEIDMKRMRQKDLASIYLCPTHFNSELRRLPKKLDKVREKEKLIEMRISEI